MFDWLYKQAGNAVSVPLITKLGNNEIIHASGNVRIDTLTNDGIIHSSSKEMFNFYDQSQNSVIELISDKQNSFWIY